MEEYGSLQLLCVEDNFFVKDLGVKRLPDKSYIVYARFNHSQRSTETLLKTWLLVKEDGEAITAHYNCMAGLQNPALTLELYYMPWRHV
ncbi:unnamed protein product [Gadus morhua 'NCC']